MQINQHIAFIGILRIKRAYCGDVLAQYSNRQNVAKETNTNYNLHVDLQQNME